MGGHIVGYYACKHPEDLSSVCMLCPHGVDFPWVNDMKNQYLKEGRHFLMPRTFDEMKYTCKQLTFKELPFPNIVLKGMLQDRMERDGYYDKRKPCLHYTLNSPISGQPSKSGRYP